MLEETANFQADPEGYVEVEMGLPVLAPITELLVNRTGITHANSSAVRKFQETQKFPYWVGSGWMEANMSCYKKYFENIRNMKCSAKNISVPHTTTCEASCVGAALGIVWDINDPTTQWPSATADFVVNSDVPPNISNKRKYPITTVTEEPSRNSGRTKKIPKHFDDGFNSIAPLQSTLSKGEVCIKHRESVMHNINSNMPL